MQNIIKKIFALDYNTKQISLMLKVTYSGTVTSNFIAPLVAVFVMLEHIPIGILALYMLANVLVLIARVIFTKKLNKALHTDKKLKRKYLQYILVILLLSAILNGVMIWIGVLYSLSPLAIFVLGSIIFSLVAGSLSTLSGLYTLYVVYTGVSMFTLISAMLYVGGEMFNVFAFNMTLFYITLIISGYRYNHTLRDAIVLENTFEALYNNSSDGIVIIENNRFQTCNVSIVDMFGLDTKEELVITPLSKFFPKYQPDGRLSLLKMGKMIKLASKNNVHSFEWLHTKIDGEEFWCEIVLTKINLKGKELIHGVWRDISQRKQIQDLEIAYQKELELKVKEEVENNMIKDRQLVHQSRLAQMGEMIGMIAHQWRQPLSAISNNSSSINLKSQMGILDDATAQKLSQSINDYTQHLSETIDDFRNFFKPNNDKDYTDYHKLLKSVLGIINDSLASHQITLTQDMQCDEELYIFPNELKQVILNLVKNSEDVLIDKNIENPYINIVSYTQGDECILEVQDNGGGITKDIIDKIFDPYFSTKMKKDGTGMGLYMSKVIVEDHCGGQLDVKNTQDGVVFKIIVKKA